MKKRILALLLAAVLLLNVCPVATVAAVEEPAIVVGNVTAVPGGTVELTIRLEHNPGIASMKLKVAFDDCLTLTSVTYNSAIGGMSMQPPKLTSPVTVNWFNGIANSTGDWTFVTLKFTVGADTPLGTYPVSVTYEADNVYNIAEENIHFHIENGAVEVVCGHPNKVATPAKAATCTAPGNNLYYTCPDCGKVLKADGITETTANAEVIPAKGHSYKSVVTAPTCTEKGYTTHTCTTCGHSYTDSEKAATGHSYGSWTQTKAPTCTGTGTERRDCKNCDHYETRTVNATGHSFGSWTQTKAPTCTAKGTERRDCNNCDHYETRDVAAKGHNYKSVVTAPTCTEKGYTTHTCANCGDSYVDTYTDAKGHSYKSVVTAPTCTEKGYTTHTCTVCGHSYTDAEKAATGHSLGSWTQTKAPTCTATGTERRDCSKCDHYETRTVAAKGHSYKAVVTAPTCTEKGYTTHTCSTCGDSYKDTYTNAKGHSYKSVVTAPTCTAKGYTTHTCTACGHSYTDAEKAATGHSYGAWTQIKAPTCTAKGSERRDCSKCDHYETRDVAAKGHSYKSVATAPTCTAQGYTTHTCTTCGNSYKDSYTNATGHSYGDWYQTKAPGCTTTGTERHDCKNCSKYETRTVAATGHNYKSVVTDPTCTEKGYTTHTCANCGNSYTDSEKAATGHSYGSWTQTKAPTCTAKGTERRDCKNCDHYETRSVAAKGHSYKSVVTAPSCTAQGYTTHTCTTCGNSYKDTYVAATGHTPGDPVEENVGEHGSCDLVVYCEVCGAELSRIHDDGYLPGDINGDGTVNNKDLIRLFQYMSDWEVEVVEEALDVNGDGSINNKDVTRLFQYLSEWDVEIH